ncbi:MAG TPA: hypothetical protein VMT34_03610 [Aggregatilineales bacterium]|nr:hypothetical protein [Aggregatilineales bacterium]
MATSTVARSLSKGRRIEGTAFDWVMMLTAIWFVGGLFVDGWAHTHGKVDQSFFTPWHAIFYSGFMAVALVIAGAFAINRSRGYDWEESIPTGYRLSLVGVVVFAFGGVFDLIWHTLFGIEQNFQALVSPSHMILILGLFLIVSGPLRAAWQRPIPRDQAPGFLTLFPTLLSMTFTYSVMTFITFLLHPFVNELVLSVSDNGSRVSELAQELTVSDVMLQAGLLTGFVLLVMRRWKLPFGSLTLLLTVNMLALQMLREDWKLVGVALVVGLLADLAIGRFDPAPDRPLPWRAFAFALPAALYLCYFLLTYLTSGIGWTVHVWLGAPVLAGIVGLLLTYVMLPVPERQPAGG